MTGEINTLNDLILAAADPVASGGNWFSRRRQGYWDWQLRSNREQVAALIDKVLRADYRDLCDPMPDESMGEASNRPGSLPWSPLAYWLDKWAVLYNEEPTRRVFANGEAIDPELQTLIDELYDEVDADEQLQNADKEMRAYGNVVLRAQYDDYSERVVLSRATTQYVRVLPNPVNPRAPYATAIVGTANGKMAADLYTNDSYALIRPGEEYEFEELATELPPVVHCFDRLADNRSGYYVEPPGARLANMVARIKADYIDQMGYILLMQGLGVLVVSGAEESMKIKVSPGSYLKFGDPQSNAYYLNPNAPLMDWRETVAMMVAQARESAGIPEALLTADVSSSGAAIIAANAPLQEQRRERGKRFRSIEQDLLRVLVDVARTYSPKYAALAQLPLDTLSVAVDYVDPAASMSDSADAAREAMLMDRGIISEAAVAMKEQPGKYATEEEAWEAITINKQRAAGQIAPEQGLQPQSDDVTLGVLSNTLE